MNTLEDVVCAERWKHGFQGTSHLTILQELFRAFITRSFGRGAEKCKCHAVFDLCGYRTKDDETE